MFLFFSALNVSLTAGEKDPEVHVLGEGATRGNIYRAPLLNNPKTLDPATAEDMYSVAVVQQLFDGLVEFNRDLLVVPALAETWQVEEGGQVYRFILREGVRFHDGSRVTAQDVVFSLSRILRMNPPPAIMSHIMKIAGAADYRERKLEAVAGLQALDDRTVRIQLEEPYAPFLIALGMYQAKIVPARLFVPGVEEFGRKPVGTGPFRFVSWDENRSVRLERFKDYYGGKVLLDGIVFVVYPGVEIEAVYRAFVNGELHEMPLHAQVKKRLLERKDLQVIHRPSLGLQFYGINCRHSFLGNEDLRRALSFAIDRKRLVAEVYDSQYEPACGILPPGLLGYRPRDLQESFSPTRAEELMTKARKQQGEEMDTVELVSNSQSALALAEIELMRESWSKLGISLKPRFIPDWAQFENYIKSDAVQIYRYVWNADMPDPDNFLLPLFGIEADANFTKYRDERVHRLLQEARAAVDPVARAALYRTIEDTVLNAAPILPLFYRSVNNVYHASVQGIQVSALGAHAMSYRGVWLKETEKP